jgi:hypothetical protein
MLDQLTGRLRDSIADLSDWTNKLQEGIARLTSRAELESSYSEHLMHSPAQLAIDELSDVVAEIKADPDIESMDDLAVDIISANEWALKLCQVMLTNSKLLAGYKR